MSVLIGCGTLYGVQDPNGSEPYPVGGHALIICGNSHYGWPEYDAVAEELLRQSYLILTQAYGFDPNHVQVLANNGEDDWTQGLFDAQPADRATVTAAFRTVGQRLWTDSSVPRNLWVILAGHGGRSRFEPAMEVQVKLADGPVYDHVFVNEIFNQLQNNDHNACPVERIDLIMTPCYVSGLVDDLRDNFRHLRGTTWPNVRHISMITSGDCYDMTAMFFAIPMLTGLWNTTGEVDDLNGDGILSVYERFSFAARHDLTNPSSPYTPWAPDMIYLPGENYMIKDYDEHPLYYEWNGLSLRQTTTNDLWGDVVIDPAPEDVNAPAYRMGTRVTLTAEPTTGRIFGYWLIYDPNHPEDSNWASRDTSNPLETVMDVNRRVEAVFQCGPHEPVGILFPLSMILVTLIVRRGNARA